MASNSRLSRAFAGIGLHPLRIQSMIDMAMADPLLASRLADAIAAGDDRALLKITAEAQWSVASAAPPTPATPRLELPGRPSIEAQRGRIEAEEAAERLRRANANAKRRRAAAAKADAEQAAPVPPIEPDKTYPTPEYQIDLPSPRAGDTLGDVPDPGRAAMTQGEDVFTGSPSSGPPDSWASDPSAPGFTPEPPAGPPTVNETDNLIARLGAPPATPVEARPSGAPRGAFQFESDIPGAGSINDLIDEIYYGKVPSPAPAKPSPIQISDSDLLAAGRVRRAEEERKRMQAAITAAGGPTSETAKPSPVKISDSDLLAAGRVRRAEEVNPLFVRRADALRDYEAKSRSRKPGYPPGLLPAAGLGLAGLGAGIYMANQAGPPQGSAATPASPPAVPNTIKPPMSTADLAAQTRPPPSVTTPQSPRDQAMKMIDDLNARRRAAGGEVPDAPETMQKINRLLAMSNEQSAAASRGEIAVQGNGPREQAQRTLAQLNAMRQQAGGEVPQAGQMMAEVRRLQAMADQQANARRGG